MNKGSDHLNGNKNSSSFWDGILQESVEKSKRSRPYASKAGYCSTANWFMGNVSGYFLATASMKLYQGIGNGVEAELVKGAERSGILLGTQVKLPTPQGVDLGGFIDMIIVLNNYPTLIEVKTCTNIPSKIKPEHAAQAAAYWIFSGLDNVEVLYVSRKVQNFPDPSPLIKSFKFDPSEHVSEINNVFQTLNSYNSQKPPQRPTHFQKNRDCLYCDFSNQCWSAELDFFMNNQEMSKLQIDSSNKKDAILSKRSEFVVKTLQNCRTSVPSENKALLEDFIRIAGRK